MQHLLFSSDNFRKMTTAATPVGGLGAGGETPSLVVFRVGSQRCAIPVSAAERVLPMVAVAPLPDAPPIALGAVNVEGRLLAVLDLQRRLGLPARELGPSAQLLVVTTSRRTVALPVDEVLGVTELPADKIVAAD